MERLDIGLFCHLYRKIYDHPHVMFVRKGLAKMTSFWLENKPQHTTGINVASSHWEWLKLKFLNIAWLSSLRAWGDYRCLSQQKKHGTALKEPLFQLRRCTESYLNLFTCLPVCFLIMWVRENPSRRWEKETERKYPLFHTWLSACLSVGVLSSGITVCNTSY